MQKLLLATNNPGKVRELRRLLDGIPFQVVTPGELDIDVEVDESGATYAENATLKARAFAAAAGCLALADDSGLEVDALGGRPGVQSARFGGEKADDRGRYTLLLEKLHGVPPARRTARFRAVVALSTPGDDPPELFEGVVEGHIALEPHGCGGFGYDPVFELPDGRTMAQLAPGEKDAISHRAAAVRAAAEWLRRQA